MRTDAELLKIALEFVTDCTVLQSVFEYAAELEQLGAHGAKIPAMRANKWKAVIEELVTVGKLVEIDGSVVSSLECRNSFRQLDLFGQ